MELSNPWSLILGAATLLAVVYWQIVRPLSHSPLSGIPGPFLAKITEYYIIFIDAAGNRTRHIHNLHQRYGPVVRIGPKEVSFTSPLVARELYSQGTPYIKAPWYEAMMLPPLGMFGLRNRKEHAARRRLLSHAFSAAALTDAEPMIGRLVLKLVERASKVPGQPVDMLQLFRRLSLDIVGDLFLGQSFQALESEEPPKFLEWMDNMFISFGIKYAFPWLYWVMTILPLDQPREIVNGPTYIAKYGEKAFYKYIEENGRRFNAEGFANEDYQCQCR